MKKELHYLCSRKEPTEEQIGKIVEIVAKDSVGLVNMVDDDGFSPLILTCRNNKSGNLIRCISKRYLVTKELQMVLMERRY